MKNLILLSLLLTFNFSFAQGRKDTLRMKDGTEILCQILRISETDSVIQFCILESGELIVKKVQTTFVDSYSWPGKEEAARYAKMLGARSIHDGDIYKGYWYIKPHSPYLELTNSEMAEKELRKGSTLAKTSFAVISAGLVTAIFIPKVIKEPTIQGSNMYSYPDDYKTYENTVKALQVAGIGIILAGTITGFLSIPHFKKAKLLSQESCKGISISSGRDGISMVLKF